MYFYLDDSLIIDEKDTEFPKIKKAIKYLSLGYLEGNHLLGGDNRILEYYKNVFYDSDTDTYSVLAELCAKSYEGIPINISFYVEVVKDISESFRIENNVTIKQIKYDYFKKSQNIQPTNFIVEDLNDAKFYKYICECTLKKHQLYLFSEQQGGGERTVETIKQSLANKEITISIIDTDKRFPEEVPPKIAKITKKCENNKLKANTIYDYLIIDAHEIENLIPLEIIQQLDIQKDNKEDLTIIINSTIANEILQYFDLKQGIFKLKTICNDSNFKKFVKKIVSLKPTILAEYNNDFETYYSSLNSVEGKRNKDDNIKGKIWPGLRKDLLEKALEYISKNKNSLLTPKLLPFQEKEWTRISNFIYTMCCRYENKDKNYIN